MDSGPRYLAIVAFLFGDSYFACTLGIVARRRQLQLGSGVEADRQRKWTVYDRYVTTFIQTHKSDHLCA
ncbi:hypothetical protein TWF569_008101 [Orbilia oligospora]|nr:hypothetical protein TWF594_004410 [Orbilia oligospora]KAF3141219.1 hypothetical protein TWF569_008101 [Orbilia oligospora]